jgi:hypothetical protein
MPGRAGRWELQWPRDRGIPWIMGCPGVNRLVPAIFAVALAWIAGGHAARADDGDLCLDEIAKQETVYGMPAGLLKAIARVESSGSPYGMRGKPWPWTLNVGGEAHYYPDKATALIALETFKATSDVNIDVGCMQISLRHHPNAFPDLATALDPVSNVDYGALFLASLKARSGDWLVASGDYHSTTPGFGDTYRNLVQIAWTGGVLPGPMVNVVRATMPAGAAIIDIRSIGDATVVRRLDNQGQPVAGSETSASGIGDSCDHRQRETSMSAGQGVRVWHGLCADEAGGGVVGNRITIPDANPDQE